ncbi:hypothetical protein B0G84_5991 [Paraburkholderia sp. BL8N3]|jgi:hypothetical protein|nr:hypothetical protein [Paraburkholderia sp. BL8N3]TCK36962.1 hypothetical protein B0G84_5991 [Paraburkholderia sp. BL8N3]
MNSGDKKKLNDHLKTHLAFVRGTLTVNQIQPPDQVRELNYTTIKTLLGTLTVNAVHANVVEAATMISKARPPLPAVTIQIKEPPKPVEVAKEIAKIKADCGYAAEIDNIYVQLDNDQNKHQPPGLPIGTRQTHGGEKFGTFATTGWHGQNTMVYMAQWAAGLTDLVEGQKKEHGQANVVEGRSYEGYCMLLGGKRYVSFHCYPAR